MRVLKLTALTIALTGFAASQAQEAPADAVSEPAVTESPAPLRWKDHAIDESPIMAQARAVYMILRAREAAEYGIEIEAVDAVVAAIDDQPRNEGNCRLLTRPGSLIREERCFYESPEDAALNEFQYEMERREIEDALARHFLEVAEYEMAFRKEQYQQSR